MRIPVKDVGMMARMLIDMLQQRGDNVVEFDSIDEYWVVSHPDWVDFSKEPILSVGSLADDWAELVRMRDGRIATPVDLDRLASILRAISAIIAPPKG